MRPRVALQVTLQSHHMTVRSHNPRAYSTELQNCNTTCPSLICVKFRERGKRSLYFFLNEYDVIRGYHIHGHFVVMVLYNYDMVHLTHFTPI